MNKKLKKIKYEDDLCICGHKRLIHSDKMGCGYCRFIEGRNYLHKFKRSRK